MPSTPSDPPPAPPYNAYQAPRNAPVPTPRQATARPLRSALLGAAFGGSLGLTLVLFLLFTPVPKGGDGGVGPMFMAVLPVLACVVIAVFAAVGSLAGLTIGLLSGGFACLMARPKGRGPKVGGDPRSGDERVL